MTPGRGPYDYPQITINAPISPPPQVLTNVASLLVANIVGVMVFRNGLLLTNGPDYTIAGDVVTFAVPPISTDVLTAVVFALGLQLGGPNPQRYIAPWSIQLAGAYDGIATIYRITTGPTITGPTDGINNLFTWQIVFSRVEVYRNGVAQTIGKDFSNGPTAAVFLPGSIPQAGDIITLYGWA